MTGPPGLRAESAARAEKSAVTIRGPPAPDYHFIASPDSRVPGSCRGCIVGAGGYPTICVRVVCPAGVRIVKVVSTAPDYHFTASPDSGVIGSFRRRVSGAGSCPTIRAWIVLPSGVEIDIWIRRIVIATPHDHLTAGPCCRVIYSAIRSVSNTGGRPTIRARIVFPTGIQILIAITILEGSAPDDHVTASPDCCVICSDTGRIGHTGSRPTIRNGVVSPTGVQIVEVTIVEESAPDDHFAAAPDCGVIVSRVRRIGDAGSRPTV